MIRQMLLVAAVGLAGCAGSGQHSLVDFESRPVEGSNAAAGVSAAVPGPSQLSVPTGTSDPGIAPPVAAIGVINGQAINNAAFYNLTMEIAGPRVFDEILSLTVVREAAEAVGLAEMRDQKALTAAMRSEYNLMVRNVPVTEVMEKEIGSLVASGMKLEEAIFTVKQRVLDKAWTQQGRTLKEVQMVIEQQTLLRAMSVVGNVKPQPDEIKKAFSKRNGERATVMMISLGKDKAQAQRAGKAIRDLLGAPTVASKVSRLELETVLQDGALREYAIQAHGTIIIPKDGDEFGVVRDMVFLGKIPAGGLSPVILYKPTRAIVDAYFIIWVEKYEGAGNLREGDPAIQKELHDAVLFEEQNTWMNVRLAELRQRARVTVNDPVLTQIYTEWKNAQTANPATSAPATVPPRVGPMTRPGE